MADLISTSQYIFSPPAIQNTQTNKVDKYFITCWVETKIALIVNERNKKCGLKF
jgi:hypothetical protein